MRAFPDELLLSAGSVGGRRSDTQHLLYGLQHCALAAAVGARHKVDVGAAGRGRNDMRDKYQAEKGTFKPGELQSQCANSAGRNALLQSMCFGRARKYA